MGVIRAESIDGGTRTVDPYRTPLDGVYLCSASTPPGGAVHGMCGYHGSRSPLKALDGRRLAKRR